MTSSFLWLLWCGEIPRTNFGHLTALEGSLYPLISTGPAGGAASSPTFQVPRVSAGLLSFYLAHPFCTPSILRQPQGDTAVANGAPAGCQPSPPNSTSLPEPADAPTPAPSSAHPQHHHVAGPRWKPHTEISLPKKKGKI